MDNSTSSGISKKYIMSITVLTFILPTIGILVQILLDNIPFSFELTGKWVIFSAVGLRLLIAGFKQVTDPAFTAKGIFNIDSPESYPILRELGFANTCFGLVALISFFVPDWRIVSAFASGLYFGIAGIQHWIKKPVGGNETYALVTDIIIFIFLLVYFITFI